MGMPAGMPPQGPPPQGPPAQQQPPKRQPQTASDPGNTGDSAALLAAVLSGIQTIGKGVDAGNADIRSVVTLQKVILKTLFAMAGSQGLEPKDLAAMARMYDDNAVQQFLAALGDASGK
jgi:hypothetical protein